MIESIQSIAILNPSLVYSSMLVLSFGLIWSVDIILRIK